MLLDFFYQLRAHKVPVGLNEWLALMEAMAKGLHHSSLTGFYHLARAILVHSEAYFDAYDQAFGVSFKGVEAAALKLTDELAEWLADPANQMHLSAEERAALEGLDLEQLREMLEQRLKEQKERHEGGSKWIGTGGKSPFGQGGYHPTGIRMGDKGGGRSAAQVAAQRRFRAYRRDLVLDVRQIKVALRKLRELRRDGMEEELDLDETVDRTCKNAGDLELVFRPPRKNRVKVVLLMDVGGSMDPHVRVMSELFSAANQSNHFRSLDAFYFHNCVYDSVYRDAWFRDALPLAELMERFGPRHKLIMVGDAMMHPLELLESGWAIDYWQNNRTPGIEWLRRLSHHFERKVWLNPEPRRMWPHITVNAIREQFPMFPLTLQGLSDAVDTLVGARKARKFTAA